MPYPLLQRMLNIVYRLRPHSCLSLPITFFDDQEQLSTSIPIPLGLKEDRDGEAIHCIANYVPAFVLNRAVSRCFNRCAIDLESFLRPRPGTERLQGVTGPGWKEKILEAYKKNGYAVLLETYLGIYNTKACIDLSPTSHPTTLQPIAISELGSCLHNYWSENQDNGSGTPLLLGIDIGGTFTKVQFYELAANNQFQETGAPFKLLTPSPGGSSENHPVHQFASRLVESVSNHLQHQQL